MEIHRRLKGRLLTILWLCLLFSPLAAPAATISLAGKRVLWLGDSITQQGGYVTLVEYYLNKHFPAENFDIISIGLSSETVSGLSEKEHPFPRPCLLDRLPRALELTKPQVVVACYGMNDGIYHPQSPERFQAFQKGVRKLIAEAKGAGAKIILLTPPPFDPEPLHSTRPADASDFSYAAPYVDYDGVLADYAKWEIILNSTDVQVIDLHTPLAEYLQAQRKSNPGFRFSADGIHPDRAGHLLMARTILNHLGIQVQNGDLTGVLTQIDSDPLFDLVAKHRQTRSDGWLAYIGYTRGETVRSNAIDPTENSAAAWQQQIDHQRRTVRVACVGDSITYGHGVSDREKNSYPALLQQWLGAGYDVRNFGVNGATMLARGDKPYNRQGEYTNALAFAPDILVIALGTNDSKHRGDGSLDADNAPDNWQLAADFLPDYETTIATFRRANPTVKIYVCLPPPCFPGRWGINDKTIHSEIDPLVRKIAEESKAEVVDLYGALTGKASLFPDTVHPNNAGAKIIAETIYHSITGRPIKDL